MLSAVRTTADAGDAAAAAKTSGPLFSCPDCAYKTTSLRKLGRHRSVNHAGVKYRCEHCDFVTGYQSNYYRHRKQVHNGGMSQSALQAAATTSASANHRQSPQQQVNRHATSANAFRNNNSAAATTTSNFIMSEEQQRILAAAIMASSAANQFRCDRCPFQTSTGEQLAAHISLVHGADAQRTCGECNTTVATKSQWQEHFRAYHGHRNQSIFSKTDYANLFNSLANNSAALTAAHLIMAAAANGSNNGVGYDLNLLASAALSSSSAAANNQRLRQKAPSPEQSDKILDLSTPSRPTAESISSISNLDSEKNDCQRFYACVYDCDFAGRSSRDYLHHLRDEHGERFAIFYCDQCDEYATKFVARLRRHKALVHDGEKSISIDVEKLKSTTENGSAKSNGSMADRQNMKSIEERDEEEEKKLSIVDVDRENSNSAGKIEEESMGKFDVRVEEEEEEMDGVFRCVYCPYATNELPRFKKHQKCHETTVDTRCQFCNFRTVYSWNLDRHVRCHRQTGKYTCRRCSFSQNTRQSMQFHLQHHHDDVESNCVETQTDRNSNGRESTFDVDVGFEAFVFEKHAVTVNKGAEADDRAGEENTPTNTSDAFSPLDSSQSADCGRHSTPTPPALLADGGASAVVQQNRRHQIYHNRLHFRRRQQQQGQRLINDHHRRMRKFLSEQEAIEIPTDVITNEFDNDPDIKNRHCSVCGYQGKWISEMIRHKRVHTNERPFKCKYCSRTSKWKADLIRHVAKVHGYRVVSKYSRSKTFDDADQTALKALKEAVQCSTPPAFAAAGSGKSKSIDSPPPQFEKGDEAESPNLDNMEFEEIEGNYDADEGLGLDLSIDDRRASIDRFDRAIIDERDEEILDERSEPEKESTSERRINDEQQSTGAAAMIFRQMVQLNESRTSTGSSSPTSSVLSMSRPSSKELRDLIGSKQLTGALEKYVTIKQADGGESILKCRVCPYETRDLHTFRAHTQKHENKKPYLCSTCGYRSNWSSDVHKHIRLKKTGHETAYVIKLNETESPRSIGDATPPIQSSGGRASTNSDCSSTNDYVNFNFESQNGITTNAESPNNNNVEAKNVGQVSWRCLKCDFDDDSRSIVVEHLQRAHRTPPYACRHCDFSTAHRKTCIYHVQSRHNSRDSTILENLTCEYRCGKKSNDDSNSINGGGGERREIFLSPPNAIVGDDKRMQPFKRKKEQISPSRNRESLDLTDGGNRNRKIDNFGNDQEIDSFGFVNDRKVNNFGINQIGNDSGISPNMINGQKIDNIGPQHPKMANRLDQATAAMMTANAAAAFAASTFNTGATNAGIGVGGGHVAKPSDWLQLAQLCFLGGFTGFPTNNTGFAISEQSGLVAAAVVDEEKKPSEKKVIRGCDQCPFVGRTESDASIHEKGHRAPNKGLMCYKCVFCEWYAPKKAAIFDHLKLHTDQPAMYRAEVERNMITPCSRKRLGDDSLESAAANALLGLAKAEKIYKFDDEGDGEGEAEGEQEIKKKDLKSENGKSIDLSISSNNHQQNGDGSVLGRSDVDEVMSDFNAIINAADQDLAQENNIESDSFFKNRPISNGSGVSINGKSIDRLTNIEKSAAVLEKLWIQKTKTAEIPSTNNVDSELRTTLDREAYIHAGEDAFDSISRSGEVVKGEIQKVTAVVDGQVRKMWQCRHCPHMSKRRANVRMHEKKHFKSSAIGVFKCPKCNYRGDKRSLHVHYRVHMAAENGGSATMPELFQCTNCPAIFLSQEDLGLHSINHNSDSSKAFRCVRCSYAVSSSSALQKHARVHDRQFASPSQADSTTTNNNNNVVGEKRQNNSNRRHANSAAIANVIVQHEEINPFATIGETALNLVTRRSKNDSAISNQHQFSTPSPTSIESSGGGQSFAASLLNPMAKPKKYLCTRCPAKFADRTQLNRHAQFHGVKLKFKCYICDYSVPFPINLTKHLKSHHNVDVSTASASESEIGDLDEASASSDLDEDSAVEDVDPTSYRQGSLKIKINLSGLKSSLGAA